MSVLLVTGGSRGIGADVCRAAAEQGWSVAVNYAQSEDAANAVVKDISDAGGTAIAVQADVASHEQVEAMFADIDRQ